MSTWRSKPAIGDLNNDGAADLIIGVYRELSYYQNTGGTPINPTFTLIDDQYLGYYSSDAAPFLVDIDNDNDLDLFVGGEEKIWYYRNDGTAATPNFTYVDSEYFALPNINEPVPCFFDMNLDGTYDLIIQYGDDIFLKRNLGTPGAPVWDALDSNYYPELSVNCMGAAMWDLDNSGLPSLLIGGQIRKNIFYTNTGTIATPVWNEAPFLWETIEVSYRGRLVLKDLTNDELPELLVFGYNHGLALRNIGTAGDPDWTVDSSLIDGVWQTNMNPTLGDLDNDGDLDMVCGFAGNSLKYYENIGDTLFPIWDTVVDNWFGISHGNYLGPALVDIDADGDLDLFVGDQNDTVRFYENTGDSVTPNFPSGIIVPEFIPSYSREFLYRPGFCFYDYDKDGDYDLLAGQDTDPCKLTYWENTGDSSSPAWGTPQKDFVGVSIGGLFDVQVWDYNNDGDDDLVCATREGGVIVFLYDEGVKVAESAQKPSNLEIVTYPNPFNSSVRISVSVPLHTIEIFDINGRMVYAPSPSVPLPREEGGKTLLPPGEGGSKSRMRAFIWQPDESVSSGVYLVRARVGDVTVTKRVVYLK